MDEINQINGYGCLNPISYNQITAIVCCFSLE